jgi:uncharacterized membrane protein YfcA
MKSLHKTVLGLLLALTIFFTVWAIVSKNNDSKKDDSEKDDSEKDDTSTPSWQMLTGVAVGFLILFGLYLANIYINNRNKDLKLEKVKWSPEYWKKNWDEGYSVNSHSRY